MRLIDVEKLEKYKADCCVSLTEWQEGWNDAIDTIMGETPTVDVIAKTEYDKLLTAAKAMHTWIFLNTVDEFEVYDECGLTDETNALLGSMGRFELKQEKDDGHTD